MDIKTKDLIVFDLDGTLAPSKQPMEPDMAGLLSKLLLLKKVAVISGGGYPQFERQFLGSLAGNDFEGLANLAILPTSGTRLLVWRGGWTEKYAEHLSKADKDKIIPALNYALMAAGYSHPEQSYGELIEDRGSQITFSGLGQNAPLEAKQAWDPDRTKRQKIADILKEKIPEFDVRIGGTTSIDITHRGVNKAYGIRKLEEHLKIPLERMVFVGDALFFGGNDYPAKTTGIDCIEVTGPEDTKKLIREWVG